MTKRTRHKTKKQGPSTKLDVALALHDEDYWLVICLGKKPLHSKWQKKRLTKKLLRQYFKQYPTANIGIVLGKNGIIDVECDSPKAEKNLHKLFKNTGLGKLPITPTYQSKRGSHYLFKCPNGLPDKATVKFDDIEFRFGGGNKGAFSVIPPSVHETGKKYKWIKDKSIFDILLAPLPKELVKRIRETTDNKSSGRKSSPVVDGSTIPKGDRNSHLASLAGTMRRQDMTESEIRSAILTVNTERCRPSLPCDEVEIITKSIAQYAPADPNLFSLTSLFSQELPELASAALHGLAGEIVQSIDPFTEAHRVGVLVHVLIGFGILVGPKPHYMVQHDSHSARTNALLVGQTSKGRKGMSWSTPKHLFSKIESDWMTDQVVSGLSSGEGLIQRLDNPENGDKRLLVIEPEFASTLTVISRQGNTLSTIIRQAWDDGKLATLTKNNPLNATGTHIGIIGHITVEELARCLTETQMANGFANRFLFLMVSRSKMLPDGRTPPKKLIDKLVEKLKRAVNFACKVGRLKRDKKAKDLWHSVYGPLSEGQPGLMGAILSRAEAQVLRLSMIYALFDQSKLIRKAHLEAALAVWEYSECSARMIFGKSTGDSVADRIYQFLAEGTKSQSDISDHLGRHYESDRIKHALSKLEELGWAQSLKKKTKGRSSTNWCRVAKKAK